MLPVAQLLERPPAIHISVPTPTKILNVRGRGTDDEPRTAAAPSRRRKDDRYSSHDCIGDMTTVKPRAHRTCLFRRVCMDTQTAEVQYYRDAAKTQEAVLFDRRYGHLFTFGHVAPKGGREDMLPLNKHVRYKRHVRWSPRIVDGPLPARALWLRPLHVLSAPFVPTNLGHLAWEEAFPLLLAMAQHGAYAAPSDTVVLRTHDCNETVAGRRAGGSGDEPPVAAEPPTASEARLCRKFVAGFMAPIGAVSTLAALAAQHGRGGVRHVCFPRLLAGGYYEMFNAPAHPGKEPWLQLYRHRVLAHHGLAPARGWPAPPRAHKALLVRKEGRRGIANFPRVLAFVRGGCGGGCEGIAQVVPAAFHTMSVREQLALVSTSTIAVTPPGGVSMILPFLPEGAHAVLINFMVSPKEGTGTERHGPRDAESCAKCSLTMEGSLWRHLRHVHTLPYQVWDASDFARGKPGRDAAVVVKMPRLAYLLRVALDNMARGGGAGE